MKLEVYSLKDILENVEYGDNIISIRDRYCEDATNKRYERLDVLLRENDVNTLLMYFDDIDPYRFHHGMEHWSIKEKFGDGTRKPIFFNSDHAREIVTWVKKLWEKDHDVTIKVHCWAGHSRSQAVAYWLNIYFNLILERNMEDYLENNARNVFKKIHFNCEVLRVFTSTFG